MLPSTMEVVVASPRLRWVDLLAVAILLPLGMVFCVGARRRGLPDATKKDIFATGKFTHRSTILHIAVTREVSRAMEHCELSFLPRTEIDLRLARAQHQAYEEALAALGCQVRRLPELPEQPDSVFVEDTAVVLDEVAVITRPGAEFAPPRDHGHELRCSRNTARSSHSPRRAPWTAATC